MSTLLFRGRTALLGAALLLNVGASASAGTYKTIAVDGAFADWDDVPVLNTDAAGDGSPIDIATVQLTNDDTNLYLRVTYHTAVNPNAGPSIVLAFDTDNNVSTGFDIYGLGTVGSEAGFQNDFPFDQRTGFNVGGVSAGAGISPYFSTTTSQEYTISRAITYSNDGAMVFGNSFTLMLWTDGGAATDVTSGIAYAFATAAAVPEPASMGSLALGGLALARRRA